MRAEQLRREIGVLSPDLIAVQKVDAGPASQNQAEELLAPLQGSSHPNRPRMLRSAERGTAP